MCVCMLHHSILPLQSKSCVVLIYFNNNNIVKFTDVVYVMVTPLYNNFRLIITIKTKHNILCVNVCICNVNY